VDATFKTLADIDYEAAVTLLRSQLSCYNTVAMHFRQAVEKELKYVLARSATHKDNKLSMQEIIELLNSHNINKIMYTSMDVFTDLYKVKSDIIMLRDYYINVNYPGVKFMFVSKDVAENCKLSADRVRACCTAIATGVRY